MDYTAIYKALGPLTVQWQELTKEQLRLYAESLHDVPLSQLVEAVAVAIRDCEFCPKPATLRRLTGMLPTDPHAPAALKARADLAWSNLRSMRTRFNAWALVDRLTKQTFDVLGGGYRTECGFGMWDVKHEEAKRREFIATYCDLARHHRTLPPLPSGPQAVAQLTAPEPNRALTDSDRASIRGLVKSVVENMVMPRGVPLHYLHDATQIAHLPLTYVPSLDKDALEARKALLRRQALQVMASTLAVSEAAREERAQP